LGIHTKTLLGKGSKVALSFKSLLANEGQELDGSYPHVSFLVIVPSQICKYLYGLFGGPLGDFEGRPQSLGIRESQN